MSIHRTYYFERLYFDLLTEGIFHFQNWLGLAVKTT